MTISAERALLQWSEDHAQHARLASLVQHARLASLAQLAVIALTTTCTDLKKMFNVSWIHIYAFGCSLDILDLS